MNQKPGNIPLCNKIETFTEAEKTYAIEHGKQDGYSVTICTAWMADTL